MQQVDSISTINGSGDVNVQNLQAGEVLSWSASTNRWINTAGSGAPSKDPLSTILLNGNSAGGVGIDMNNQSIGAVNQITAGTGAITTIAGTTANYTTGNFTDVNATGSATVGTLNYTTLNPPIPIPPPDTLADVLATGNSAGTNDIDCNNNNILNCSVLEVTNIGGDPAGSITAFGTIAATDMECQTLTATQSATVGTLNYTTLNPAIPGAEGLADTLLVSNSAGVSDIDMNSNDILNGGIINCVGVQATGLQAVSISSTGAINGTALTISKSSDANSGFININATTQGAAKLDFTGVSGIAGKDTEIEGDDTLDSNGLPKRTICSYLDLTSPTNLFTPSEQERYEWGGYWEDPNTVVDPAPQQIAQVFMGSYQDNFPGWRFFRPMSDGNDQIPTGSGITKFAYIPYLPDANNPLLAFYVKTAPTTVAAHASQIVNLSFPVTRYGYGRIYLGLYYVPDSNPSATPVFIDQSFRLLTENIAQPGVADLRKGGHVIMEWVLKDVFPTDGSVWRIYPVMRTDDSYELGALEIRIGDNRPHNSGFVTPPLPRNGQLFMYGRPWSQSFTSFSDRFVPPSSGV